MAESYSVVYMYHSFLIHSSSRTSRLFPCPGYYKQCCDEHWGLLDSEEEGEGGMIWENGIETCILSCRKQITVYVQCRIQHAWGWCTGMIQRDGVGWEVGEGFMFGSSCTPVVDSCQCMAKPIQYCKVK